MWGPLARFVVKTVIAWLVFDTLKTYKDIHDLKKEEKSSDNTENIE